MKQADSALKKESDTNPTPGDRPELTLVSSHSPGADTRMAEADLPGRQRHFPAVSSWPGMAVMSWLLATLVGAAGMSGWLGGPSIFASYGAGLVPIAHSEATLIVVLSLSLVFYVLAPTRVLAKPVASAAILLTTVFALLKLTEYFAQAQFGIEKLFTLPPGTLNSLLTGNMSPVAAADFVFVGVSLFMLIVVVDQRKKAIEIAAYLTCAALLPTLAVFLSYCVGSPLFNSGSIIPMSFPTSLAFLFLHAGTLIAIGPEHGPLRFAMKKHR